MELLHYNAQCHVSSMTWHKVCILFVDRQTNMIAIVRQSFSHKTTGRIFSFRQVFDFSCTTLEYKLLSWRKE
jgi:hypothetical protein